MDDLVLRAAAIRPAARQLAWQDTGFYAFIHFGINTFTNREWGLGDESPGLFNPSALDARQWVRACKSAGMRALVLTCKHHDGFCLWPSLYTGHSVKNSPWRDGGGDLVREVSDACREAGLKFGVYLSPWDRHEPSYGDSDAYNRYYMAQLEELLTGYGPVFCVWMDGACGEGPNGRRQVYDWDGYYTVIRRLQPDAAICICGPDARWCGNEAGHCRQSEWSVVPASLLDVERIQELSQKADDGQFSRLFRSGDEDLGSRDAISHASELVWYPAEVDTSIRPGWFYHPEEDGAVRPLDELLEIWYSSVGGNANLLLNIPPDRRGLIHENDAARLRELGDAIQNAFRRNLAEGATASASEWMPGFGPEHMLGGDGFWRPYEGTESAELVLELAEPALIDCVDLAECTAEGQRIEEFALEARCDGAWREVFRGTVVGHRKICRFDEIRAEAIRLRIQKSRWYPTLQTFGVYCRDCNANIRDSIGDLK